MKKVIIGIVIFAKFFNANAQQEVMVSQYMFNGLFLNPAYAGSHKYVSSTLTYRNQWVDFAGAPKTFLLAVDGPLLNQKMGLGLILSNDKIGVTGQTDIYANYSYFVKLGEGKLGFGIKAGVSQYTSKVSDLTVWDSNDPSFQGTIKSALIPKFGFGTYYYTEKWYVGFSIPALVAENPKQDYNFSISNNATIQRHYYLTGGYVFKAGDKFNIKPTFLLKKEDAAPFQIDLNVMAFYMNAIGLGVSYRSGDAVSIMLNYQANKKFRIGYAYDITTSAIRTYSSGSHEIMLGFDFGKDIIKTKTPRYF